MNPFANMNKTLIIDADSVVYICCHNANKDLAGETDANIIVCAADYCIDYIASMLDSTGCKDVECYFTSGRSNFRYLVDPKYKANRTKSYNTPLIVGLSEVKAIICDMYKGAMCVWIEADDIVVYRGKQENTVIAAIDKDVLSQSHGHHWNYKKCEWVYTSKEDAAKFVWLQMIQGDSVDGIYGVLGMGKVKARKYLADVHIDDCRIVVKELYKEKGNYNFLSNLNLLDMHLLQDDGTIKLHID